MHSTSLPGCARPVLRQYLSFRLGGLEYALDYANVRELRPWTSLERFSDEGELINGVAMSRGVIMPIVDMRIAFGPRPPKHDPRTDVIILQLTECVMGMVTDGVTDVVMLDVGAIEPMPGLAREVEYLLGIGESASGRKLIVVDIDRLMAIRQVARGALHAA